MNEYVECMIAAGWITAGDVDGLTAETAAIRDQLTSAQETIAELSAHVDDMEFAIMRANAALAYPDHVTQSKMDEARGLLKPYIETGYGERVRVADELISVQSQIATLTGENNRLQEVLRETYLHLTVGDDRAEYKIQNALEELLPNVVTD